MSKGDAQQPVSQAGPRKRVDGLKTIARILKAAEEEMAEHGFVKFSVDGVIERSGVARSSVYHHFGGRDGLISAVETASTMKSLERGTAEFEKVLDGISSGEEAFALIEYGIRIFRSSENRQRRQRRISTLAAAQSAPAIREVLMQEQQHGSENLARLLAKVKERGLADPVEPFLGLAYVIQSLLVGRVLVDISDNEELDKEWEDAAISTLRLILRPKSAPN
jgi:AcrR family transcriptional regulator